MNLFVTFIIIMFLIVPISIFITELLDNKNLETKRNSILFDATITERNVSPEEVFKTLDIASIKISFTKKNRQPRSN